MMPELICPDHATLVYLEALDARITAILRLSGETNAWHLLHRLRQEVRQEIAAGWAGLDQVAEEMEAADLREREMLAD